MDKVRSYRLWPGASRRFDQRRGEVLNPRGSVAIAISEQTVGAASVRCQLWGISASGRVGARRDITINTTPIRINGKDCIWPIVTHEVPNR